MKPKTIRDLGSLVMMVGALRASVIRLGEQKLGQHGEINIAADLTTTLDCKQFGSNYVMVGMSGADGQGVDYVKVICAAVLADSTLSSSVSRTDRWGGTAGTPFERKCQSGEAVIGIRGKILNDQPRGIALQCQKLTTSGLATGTNTRNLSYAGDDNPGIGASSFGPENCGSKRPARALKVGKDPFHSGIPFGNLFSPIVIAYVQMICEQPEIPLH